MKKPSLKGPADLRKIAEEKLKRQVERLTTLSGRSSEELVHELGTHQIELEMQNEELKRAQIELEKAMRKYTDLYDLAPVGYFIMGEKGTVLSVNSTGAGMLGLEKNSILKMPFSKFVLKDDRETFFGHLREVFGSSLKQTVELRLSAKGGDEMTVQLQSVFSDDEDDKSGRCRTAVIDITERKQAEERNACLNARLERKIAELSALNQEIEAFGYAISYKLRSPLRSIKGFSRAIVEDYGEKLDEGGKDYFKRIIKAGKGLSDLIDGLVQLSVISCTDHVIGVVNLSAVASEIARSLSSEGPERNVDFFIQDRLYANGSPSLLRALLENLIGNAWKFTIRQKQPRIEIGALKDSPLISTLPKECKHSRANPPLHPSKEGTNPSLQPSREGIIYYVRDNGIGFDMANVDKIFLPFGRLVSEGEFAGTGIGLAIVHRIITWHGGRVWAEGSPDEGAVFYFTLPPADVSAESDMNLSP